MEIDKLPVKEREAGERIEHVDKKQKEYKLVGKARMTPGHTLFSFNRKTLEIKVAKVEKVCEISYQGKRVNKAKIAVEPDCFYGQALNRKNFIKRLRKLGLLEEEQS